MTKIRDHPKLYMHYWDALLIALCNIDLLSHTTPSTPTPVPTQYLPNIMLNKITRIKTTLTDNQNVSVSGEAVPVGALYDTGVAPCLSVLGAHYVDTTYIVFATLH